MEMEQDYLTQSGYAGLIPRMKRLSDQILVSGRNFYKAIGADIEPNWFLVFRILNEDGVTTLSQITQKIKFSHPSVISIVKKMKAAGYVVVTQHAKDSRKQEIRLTQKAKDAMEANERIWSACDRAMGSIFPDRSFLQELARMEKAFEQKSFKDMAIHQLAKDHLELIPYQDCHAQAFDELNREWLETYFYVEPYDDELLKKPRKYFLDTGGHIIMAQAGDYSVGTTGLLKHDDNTLELAKMAVSPDQRGAGIGHKIIQAAIDYAKETGYKDLILYSNTKLGPAIHLYKKFGFQTIPVEEGVAYERCNIKMTLPL